LHLPTRYMDRTRITPIGGLQPNAHYVIEGSVRASDIVIGKRRSLLVRLQDDTGTTSLRFYHFNKAQKERFAPGARLRVFGETRRGSAGLEFYHPEYESADTRNTAELEASLTPVYPATDGLSQSRLRQLSSQALQWLNHHTLQELIPEPLRDRLQQSAMADAIRFLHHPPASANLQQL